MHEASPNRRSPVVRWLALIVFVVVFGGVCFRLGLWQWHRHDERIARNEVAREHIKAEPRPLDDVVARGGTVTQDDEWTRITVTGTYDVEHQASVKFLTRDSMPGVDVVTPLRLSDGTAVLVDRGWMQSENSSARPDLPDPVAGQVTVTGWLRPDNGATGNAVTVIDGQVRAISTSGFASSVPYDLRSGYLNLRTEDPGSSPQLQLEPDPDLGQGPHFFYALQWWFFGLLGPVGVIWFARDEVKDRRGEQKPQASATRST